MAWENRTEITLAQTGLVAVVAQVPEDRYLRGALWTHRGWYWWWHAISPDGQTLSATVQGPYPTEHDARHAADLAASGVAPVARHELEARAA